MQILHYCTRLRLEDGGVVRAILDLTCALAKSGKSVTLLSTEGEDWHTSEDGVQSMTTGPFDRHPIRFSASRLASLRAQIDQADILHLHTPWEPANLQLAHLARKCGTPYVISVHGMLDDWAMTKSSMKKRLFLLLGCRKMFHSASAVHCTAEAEAQQVKRWIPKSNINVVPLVFDPSQYLNPPPTSDPDKHWPTREIPRPIVLFLSRIHPKKGVDRLIHAASKVCALHQVRFIIAGSGDSTYERSLHSLVEKLDVQDHVEFVGFVNGDRKTSLLRASDIFVLPTSQENFGLVFPEAMACGIPIITTKGVDIWPELEESGGAFIINEDAESTANAIIQLLDDDALRTKMGVAGRKWVTKTFAGNTVVNRYIEMYRQAINQ